MPATSLRSLLAYELYFTVQKADQLPCSAVPCAALTMHAGKLTICSQTPGACQHLQTASVLEPTCGAFVQAVHDAGPQQLLHAA